MKIKRFFSFLLILVMLLTTGCSSMNGGLVDASAAKQDMEEADINGGDGGGFSDDIESEDPDDFNTFQTIGDADVWGQDALKEEGLVEEPPVRVLPEDPLERLQYDLDTLPDPDFYTDLTDFNDQYMTYQKYGSFASDIADRYYELSEEEQEALDISRLEAYFLWETSLVDPLAGDYDRLNPPIVPKPLTEKTYSADTFPEDYSHLVLYTRSFTKVDEVGSGCTVRQRYCTYENYKGIVNTVFSNNTAKDPNVWFRINRVARIDEQDYDIKVYTWTSRPATTCIQVPGVILINAAAGGLGWQEEQPVIYTEWHFINSDNGKELPIKGAITVADIDWHPSADQGLSAEHPDNTSKKESIGVCNGGTAVYKNSPCYIDQDARGWFWGTRDVDSNMPEAQLTFAFDVSQSGDDFLTFAYYGSWHYVTVFDSTRADIHYNIAPKSDWFPPDSDLTSMCPDYKKNHCIHVDTNRLFGTYSQKAYQNDLTPPEGYIFHGWYLDKRCTKKAPLKWTTYPSETNCKELWAWYEKESEDGSGQTWMELDKTLTKTGEKAVNNQDTWNITLTQKYYDTNTMAKAAKTYAPLASYFNLLIDSTTSMNGDPLTYLNTSIDQLIDSALRENQRRMEAAKAGDYADINASLSDSQIQAAMKDHLVYISRIVGFHSSVNPKTYNGKSVWDAAPLTAAEADALKTAAHIQASDLGTGTGLTAALDYMDAQFGLSSHWGTVHIENDTYEMPTDHLIVVMDGMPDVKGERYSSKTTSAKAEDVNGAINMARNIKDAGIKIYGIWDRGIDYATVQNAMECNEGKGDLNKLSGPFSDQLVPIFMGLLTSDSPSGGVIAYEPNKVVDGLHIFWLDIPAAQFDRSTCYKVNGDVENQFGAYTYLNDRPNEIIDAMSSIASEIVSSGYTSSGTIYAGPSSYVYDVISDPFEVTDVSAVTVYAVPRIPKDLDEDGIPVGVDMDPESDSYGLLKDEDFRLGEWELPDAGPGEPKSEWIDITSQVSLYVKGGVVKVSGWNYEANALTRYDKDLAKAGAKDPFVYESGDYGYEIVVEIPINAKRTFGGNAIETNNSDVSAFYPSVPSGPTSPSDPDYIPRWPENTEENPEGNPWILKYPSPKVDLYIDYKIVSDPLRIYAPQTATIDNLVTDENYSIFYEDPMYASLTAEQTSRQEAYEKALNAASEAASKITEMSSDDDRKTVAELYAKAEAAKDLLAETKANLEGLASYRPDGINNAFVDLDYTFKDPDGEVLGTMHIPHGQAFLYDEAGNPTIQWDFTNGANQMITKSGIYPITCTVTPVDTNRAPGGHVYTDTCTRTDADGNVVVKTGYSSLEYSPTGSAASGPIEAETIAEEGSAYLFQLEITTKDTRLLPRQTLDFYEGGEYLDKTENPHIKSWRWVCTDGETESIKDDEPGISKELYVGRGGPMIVNTVPDKAFTDGKAMESMGTRCVGQKDGDWVPVGSFVNRNIGNLNKSVDLADRLTQTNMIMTDADNIWGEGVSSVVWKHVCDSVEDCDGTCFKEAAAYSGPDGEVPGVVRYLIHIENNPTPEIHKTTSTPLITKGDDIKWNVQLLNNNEEKNPRHASSDFYLVDVLPFMGDTDRIDEYNREGSSFNGDLKFTGIRFDLSNAPLLWDLFEAGDAFVYLTEDLGVRTASEQQMINSSVDGAVKWTQTEVVLHEEDHTVSVASIGENVQAFKLSGRLAFGETLSADLTANIRVVADQKPGDWYINRAVVYNGNDGRFSEDIVTEVDDITVSGTVWEDIDANGLMSGTEMRIENSVATLYRKYNPNNGGSPDRVIGDLKLTEAFDTNNDKMPSFITGDDGYFEFRNAQNGTFYIIVDQIDEKYAVTKQRAGVQRARSMRSSDEPTDQEKLQSLAELEYVTNVDHNLDCSAIINEVTVNGKSVHYQNVGLKLVEGKVKVWKSANELYFASHWTEEDIAKYRAPFIFTLKNLGTGDVYEKAVVLSKDNYGLDENGKPQVSCEFTDLPLGTYELTEITSSLYTLKEIEVLEGEGAVYKTETKTMTIEITSDDHDFEVHAKNVVTADPPDHTPNGTKNWVNVRVPVSLDVTYVGDDPIFNHNIVKYKFQESDFDPKKGGDMVVTYDDGTTISLSKGTLKFENVTLMADMVTNKMNSSTKKVGISGFYAEKGHIVSDNFKVSVDLKPVHKFQLNFDANTSVFDNGAAVNVVHFAYDDVREELYVTMGDYKDGFNGGLKVLPNFTFTGWNTQPDGMGVNYDDIQALTAIGQTSSIDTLTLYARWTTNVTFYGNGGTLAGGRTANETKLVGKASGTVPYHLGQNLSTGLYGTKSEHTHIFWNTKSNGTGTQIENYGKCKGPESFYAIYYRSEYPYCGGSYTMSLPATGRWQITAWGGAGSQDVDGLYAGGGTTTAVYSMNKGDVLTITPGGRGEMNKAGGFNGGGRGAITEAGWTCGGGGGMTDVKRNGSMLLVAGGGGGGWQTFGQKTVMPYQQGNRQGYDDWNYVNGSGQTASGNAGGGGAGWPGGKAGSSSVGPHSNIINCGAGGKGYIAPGALSSSMQSGNWTGYGKARVLYLGE